VLTDGTVLTTQNGQSLVIRIRGGVYYVNGARITQANIITENGVVHIIDQVSLTASTIPRTTLSTNLFPPLAVRYCHSHRRLLFHQVVCCLRRLISCV
jgi:hypothetical protein